MKKNTIKRIIIAIITITYTASVPLSVPVFANQDFYSANDILFYESGVEEQACTIGPLKLTGSTNQHKIYNFLISKGLNTTQAAGVLGNIQRESGYSPMRHEASHAKFSGGGYGIAQWTGGRRTNLEKYFEKKIPDLYEIYYDDEFGDAVTKEDGYVARSSKTKDLMPEDSNDAFLSAELDFLFDETSSRRITARTASRTSATQGSNEWESIKKATSLKDASDIWLYNFEIPKNIEAASIARAESGEKILKQLQKESTSESSDQDSNTGCNSKSGDISALQATVKSYAWPIYHKAPFVNLKDEYKKAVVAAQKSGGYVGGTKYKGVDCGGFVTRVMVDSGYEPSYNSAKGPTATQKAWLDSNWENIGTGSTVNIAGLKPGDVAMKTGHTFMFAGTNIEGFGAGTSGWKGVASASLDERAPMAGVEQLDARDLTWYRKRKVDMPNHE